MRPFSVTVIRWVARFAYDTREFPMLKWIVPASFPHSPPPAFHPVRFHATVTCSPVGQNVFGRKCSSRSLNQCQPPTIGFDSVTER